MTKNRGSGEEDLGLYIALLACIIGGGLRLYTAYIAGFPINDGGLFFNMTNALQQNGFSLPRFIHYNGLEIPFAYPPLAFYLANLVREALRIPLIEVFRWFPAVVTTISIYAVFILADRLLDTRIEAGVAALIYALLPRSITWLIMGGGITRSLGQVFLILTAYNLYRLFSGGERKYLWFSILTSSLVCLTHPEATIHTIGLATLIWFFKGRNARTALHAFIVALGTLAVTALWWFPTLINFGIAPFRSAAQTGLHDPLFFLYFFIIPFSDEPHLTFIIVFAILGLVVSVARKRYLLPLFYFVPFVIEPRNAANVSAIPMSMLASLALSQLILPGLNSFEQNATGVPREKGRLSLSAGILSVYVFLAMFIGMLHFSVQLADKRVTDGNLAAFTWVANHTPPDSQFLVLTGKTDLFGDWTMEWFPTLTLRTSATTIQGREWTDAQEFTTHTRQFQSIQGCLFASEPLACIKRVSQEIGLGYDYIYIARKTMRSEKYTQGTELVVELKANVEYPLVYETNEVVIFQSP
jgi:hypothetical protein